jgi:hypothetical protein
MFCVLSIISAYFSNLYSLGHLLNDISFLILIILYPPFILYCRFNLFVDYFPISSLFTARNYLKSSVVSKYIGSGLYFSIIFISGIFSRTTLCVLVQLLGRLSKIICDIVWQSFAYQLNIKNIDKITTYSRQYSNTKSSTNLTCYSSNWLLSSSRNHI